FHMFDAMTGKYILSIVNCSSMTLTEDANGNLIGYFVNSTNANAPTLNMWNSTRSINIGQGGSQSSGYPTGLADNWMWRPRLNAVLPFYVGIQWTAPLATNLSGQPIRLSIGAINSGAILMTQGSASSGAFQRKKAELHSNSAGKLKQAIVQTTDTSYGPHSIERKL
ncbi:MAG: hypothetical protein M1490_02075, partial [Candidatus Bathyarchaeota archaeon]|nr:hypothetical protein [Candidatus Bathyarchaeota archaeon]